MRRQVFKYLQATACAIIVIGSLLFFVLNQHETNAKPVAEKIAAAIKEALTQDLPDTTIVIPDPHTLAISHEYEMPIIQVDNSPRHQVAILRYQDRSFGDTQDKPQPFNYNKERSKLERLHLHPFVRADHIRKLEDIQAYRSRLQDHLNQPPKIIHIEPTYSIDINRSFGFSTGNVTKYQYDNPSPPAVKITDTQVRDPQVVQLWVGDTYDLHNSTPQYPAHIITVIQCNLTRSHYSPLSRNRNDYVELTQVDTDLTSEQNLAKARDEAVQLALQMLKDSGKL